MRQKFLLEKQMMYLVTTFIPNYLFSKAFFKKIYFLEQENIFDNCWRQKHYKRQKQQH